MDRLGPNIALGGARGSGGAVTSVGSNLGELSKASFAPPTLREGGRPPALAVTFPPGTRALASFRPGAVLHGLVEGGGNGEFFLRLGEHIVQARSSLPLQVGQPLSLRVQGELDGLLHLQVLERPFTKMSVADVAQALVDLQVPTNDENLALAKTMVEFNIPLTKDNFNLLRSMLVQIGLPSSIGTGGNAPGLEARVGAVHFLQSNDLPVTPHNVSVLAGLMENNAQLGSQLFELNREFRRLTESVGMDRRVLELVGSVPGAIGEIVLESKRKGETQRNARKLFSAAKQLGIETHIGSTLGFGAGDDDQDLLKLLRRTRQELAARDRKGDLSRFLSLMEGVEHNLEAHKLINQAKPESAVGYYYLQVPMRLDDGEYAELWLKYYKDDEGSKQVDPHDTRIEFLISTEFLGELSFVLELRGNCFDLELGAPSEEVRKFASRYLPALVDRLQQLGWVAGAVRAVYRSFVGRRRLVERTDFSQLERCNVQA